jgi:hypothetical protein
MAKTLPMSPLTLSIVVLGVFFGVITPYQFKASNPGTVAATTDTSGRSAMRLPL